MDAKDLKDLKVGDRIVIPLELVVVGKFWYEGENYLVFTVDRKKVPWDYLPVIPLWIVRGTTDITNDSIPKEVIDKALSVVRNNLEV